MGKKIIDAKKNAKGNITSVLFSGNTSFTPIEVAINMADRGEIQNAHAVHPQKGNAYLRSNPDSKTNNNLDELAKD